MNENSQYSKAVGLRFGVLSNACGLVSWQVSCLEYLLASGHQPVVVIVNKTKSETLSGYKKLANYPWRKLFYRLHQRFLFRPTAKSYQNYPALKHLPQIDCVPIIKGFSEYFPQETMKEIEAVRPDFLLRFGFNILRGEILEVCKYGVWSFHHDDEQKYRGGPPAFWEIMNCDPVNGVILQKLTKKLDAGIVLKKVWFGVVSHSWEASLDRVLMEAAYLPAQAANDIVNGEMEIGKLKPAYTEAPVFKTPGNALMVKFLTRVFWNKIRFHYHELFMAEKWNVGLIQAAPAEILESPETCEPVWMPEPPGDTFFADPFVVSDGGNYQVFFENYHYKSGLGKISQAGFLAAVQNFLPVHDVMKKNYHLAYPFIFAHENDIFLIPESADNQSIDLYRLNKNNKSLVFDSCLLSGIDAVDTTLFVHAGMYWLFLTRKTLSDTHLYIYFSDTLRGFYNPHPQNPVKSDVRSSRPAGTPFYKNGRLIRPAQDCSLTYGGAVVMNEVLQLTPTNFEEKPVARLKPFNNTRYSRGFHTFASCASAVAVDGKRYVFSFWHFIRILNRKINNILH